MKIDIHAQKYVMASYKKFGFKRHGKQFIESGIPHFAMSVSKDEVAYPSDCANGE